MLFSHITSLESYYTSLHALRYYLLSLIVVLYIYEKYEVKRTDMQLYGDALFLYLRKIAVTSAFFQSLGTLPLYKDFFGPGLVVKLHPHFHCYW